MVATHWNRFKDAVGRLATAVIAMVCIAPSAFAQTTVIPGDHSGAICTLANYYKELIGGVALIAGIVWFVGYVNKKESLSDLAQTVLIGCIVVGVMSYLIGMTGLTLPTGC